MATVYRVWLPNKRCQENAEPAPIYLTLMQFQCTHSSTYLKFYIKMNHKVIFSLCILPYKCAFALLIYFCSSSVSTVNSDTIQGTLGATGQNNSTWIGCQSIAEHQAHTYSHKHSQSVDLNVLGQREKTQEEHVKLCTGNLISGLNPGSL